MTIGEKIKKLRKEHDVTQEKLADYLNITYQAVSKWENGTAMPDITLVVPIANFFGVSTDTLFDVNSQMQNEETKEIERVGFELAHRGLRADELEHWRKAVEKYPKNYSFLMNLAKILWMSTSDGSLESKSAAETERLNEAVSICLRIEEDCTDDHIRAEARQILVLSYRYLGDEEKSVEAAMKASHIWFSKDILLAHVYDEGEKKIEQNQKIIELVMGELVTKIQCLSYDTIENEIFAIETALNILKAVIYDENYVFYNCTLFLLYRDLASCHARRQDKAKTMEALVQTRKFAEASDKMWDTDKELQYTSIFMNRIKFNPIFDSSKNYTETHVELLKNAVKYSKYDFLRNDADFIEFEKSL